MTSNKQFRIIWQQKCKYLGQGGCEHPQVVFGVGSLARHAIRISIFLMMLWPVIISRWTFSNGPPSCAHLGSDTKPSSSGRGWGDFCTDTCKPVSGPLLIDNTLEKKISNWCLSARFNSLWPSNAIDLGQHWLRKTVMACCLTAPSHYLNQCWLIISKVQWHSSEGNFTRNSLAISD